MFTKDEYRMFNQMREATLASMKRTVTKEPRFEQIYESDKRLINNLQQKIHDNIKEPEQNKK